MTMNRKVAAVLLAATMLATPAFAAGVVSSANTPTAQTVFPEKVTKAPSVKETPRSYALVAWCQRPSC